MKKLISILCMLALCLSVGAIFSACGTATDHIYSDEWTTDATHHWHECADVNCTEIADKAEHTFENDVCSVCGYTRTGGTPPMADVALPVADRIYSLLGEENRGVLCLSLDKNGKMLSMTLHDLDLSYDEDIAIFTYDAQGTMTGVTVEDVLFAVTAYDADGRPTRTESDEIWFEYNKDVTGIAIDGDFYTMDKYGRCIAIDEYTLTFDGNVGTWVETGHDASDDFYVVTYEDNTRLVRLEEWYGPDQFSYYFNYTYNEKGLPTKVQVVEDPLEDHCDEYLYVLKYDEKDQLIKVEEFYREDGEMIKESETCYEYDEAGRKTKELWIDEEGNVYRSTTYEYNENGKLIKETGYNGDGLIKSQETYEYHANGRLAKVMYYTADSSGSLKLYSFYEYREDGSELRNNYVRYNGAGEKYFEESYEYYYDGSRMKECMIHYQNGLKNREEIWEYRADGTLSKVVTINYDENGNESNRQETRFDEDGNQIQ